jgi:hypothetical protein
VTPKRITLTASSRRKITLTGTKAAVTAALGPSHAPIIIYLGRPR